MSKKIAGVVAAVLVIAVLSGFLLLSPPQGDVPLSQSTVKAFELNEFTDPTANFIAALANLLIEATR